MRRGPLPHGGIGVLTEGERGDRRERSVAPSNLGGVAECSRCRVTLIVLNWNGAADTIECLASLHDLTYRECRIIIVDNGSQDASAEKIRAYLVAVWGLENSVQSHAEDLQAACEIEVLRAPSKPTGPEGPLATDHRSEVVLIRNRQNLGFSAGNNVGIRYAIATYRPDYVFLLNNDTAVEPSLLSTLVSLADGDPKLAVVGPQIGPIASFEDLRAAPLRVGRVHPLRYPGYRYTALATPPPRGPGSIVTCDWVTAAGALIRTASLGPDLLNEAYFFGCEDVEFCIRVRRQGWRVGVTPDAVVFHKEGSGRRKLHRDLVRRELSQARHNFLLARRNFRSYPVVLYLYVVQALYFLVKDQLQLRLGIRFSILPVGG